MTDDQTQIREAFARLALPEAPARLHHRLVELAATPARRDLRPRPWAFVGLIVAPVAVGLLGWAILGPGAIPQPTPGPSGQLARYDTGTFSFSYPASWRTYHYNVVSSFSATLVYLATVDVPEPCETTQTSEFTQVDCQDRWRLTPDSVVVVVSANGRPGFDIANLPAGAASIVVDGQPGYLEKGNAPTGDPTWTWTFANPDAADNFFAISATFRGPDSGAISTELFALVDSIRFDAPHGASRGPTAVGSAELPSAGGTCSASQFVLGKPTSGYGYGTLGTTVVFVTQPMRNAGGRCLLVLPKLIGVTSATRPLAIVSVTDAPPSSVEVQAGMTLPIELSARWWIGVSPENGTPFPAPACNQPISEVTRVTIPFASGTIQLDLDPIWRTVCTSPASVGLATVTK